MFDSPEKCPTNILIFSLSKYFIFFLDNNELIVIRNCAILSEIVCDTLKNDSRSDSSTTFCEVCDTDYCNNAQKLFISWNLLCLIVLTNRVIV